MSAPSQPSEVAAFVQRARRRMGLTLEAFGERFSRTKANVHGWEKGLHEPAFAVLVEIAGASGEPLPGGLTNYGSVGEPASSYTVDVAPPSDAELIAQLGRLLARVPPTLRSPLADLLAGWAREGGNSGHEQALLALLSACQKRPARDAA